jgi:hypothetical protein
MKMYITPTLIFFFFFRVSSLLISLLDRPSVKEIGIILARDEGAIFPRLGNFAETLAGMSSSDVGCVEDDPEWGVFRRCKADAGVVKEDPFVGSESESESRMT